MEVIKDKESNQVAILMSEKEAGIVAGTLMCIPWHNSTYGALYNELYSSIVGHTFDTIIKTADIRPQTPCPAFLLKDSP